MENLYTWGMDSIHAIQRLQHPALTVFMKSISFLGSEYVYFLILTFIFWCVDQRKGLRLGTLVLLSAWLNLALKSFFNCPRPYDLDPAVGLAHDKTAAFPSGHAQSSVSFWGALGALIKKPLGILLAIGIPLLISFTRLYLGVHFPTDLFAGWIVGGIVLAVYFGFTSKLERFMATWNIRIQILLIAIIVFIMNAIHPEGTNASGAFFGMGLGYILMVHRFPFSTHLGGDGNKASLWVYLFRYLLGILGAALIYGGLKILFPSDGSAWYSLGHFIRYTLVGFWVSAGAPFLFLRFKLAAPWLTETP